MANKNLSILLCLFLAACGGGSSGESSQVHNQIRSEIMADLGLAEGFEPSEAVERAREWIYIKNNPLPASSSSINEEDPYQNYIGIKYGTKSFACAGMSYTLAWMLEQIGIPARQVSIAAKSFFDGTNPYATHQTTEAFINGEWIVHDPSFNVTFQCDGNTTSVAGLMACQGPITWTYGSVVFSSRTLEVYPVPFAEHLYGYHYYESTLKPESIPDYPFAGWYL